MTSVDLSFSSFTSAFFFSFSAVSLNCIVLLVHEEMLIYSSRSMPEVTFSLTLPLVSLIILLCMYHIALSLFMCMSIWVCLADLALEFLQDKVYVSINLCKSSDWLCAWTKVNCSEWFWSKWNFRPSDFLELCTVKLKFFNSLAKLQRTSRET